MTIPRPLATREQVADYLGVSVQTLDRWRKAGKGPSSRKLGRSVRYDWADVEAWVRRNVKCPAHGAHPHNGMRCLDCPLCTSDEEEQSIRRVLDQAVDNLQRKLDEARIKPAA